MNIVPFKLIQQSIYSPELYRGLRENPFSFSIKYFLSIAIPLSVIGAALFSIQIIPSAYRFLRNIGPEILRSIPDDMEVRITKGIVSTNVEEPFAIPLRPEMVSNNELYRKAGAPKNILVIDTNVDASISAFQERDTLVLLTRDMIVVGGQDEFRARALSNVTFTTTKDSAADMMKKILSSFKWLIPIFVFGIFLFIMAFIGFKLIYLLFGALLIMLIGLLKKAPLRYREAYQAGIHAMTPSLFVDFAVFIYTGERITLLFTAMMSIVAWINLKPRRTELGAAANAIPKHPI